MLAYPFGRVGWFEAVATSLLLALSQAAVAAGYYSERSRGRYRIAKTVDGTVSTEARQGR
jgi:hypothetical protein